MAVVDACLGVDTLYSGVSTVDVHGCSDAVANGVGTILFSLLA